jgi:NCAIR mutase (PurE)-related protein
MDPRLVRELLERVRAGEASIDDAMGALRALPFRDLGFATVDHHRAMRNGVPEVIFGERKTTEQIAQIAEEVARVGQNVLVTRVDAQKGAALEQRVAGLRYAPVARTASLEVRPIEERAAAGTVAVVTAGTSDLGVAEEAMETLRAVGLRAVRHYDVGVAGIHRLLHRVDELQKATAVIVAAGMEGALPSVVGGIVSAPIVAVPTSVGYGTAMGGFTALFAMLTSCASGVVVVNIDSGFGAAMAVHRILSARERGVG